MKFRQFLLEARMERETTHVSRSIINAIKNNANIIKQKGSANLYHGDLSARGVSYSDLANSIELAIDEDLGIPKIFVNVTIEPRYYTSVGGSYSPSQNILQLNIRLSNNDVKTRGLVTTRLVGELKKTLQHELEHLAHYQKEPSIFSAKALKRRGYPRNQETLDDVIRYLLDPTEVPAHMGQFYRAAKMHKKPFNYEVDNFFNRIKFSFGDKHSQEELDERLDQVKQIWLDYAKTRYPKAKYKT